MIFGLDAEASVTPTPTYSLKINISKNYLQLSRPCAGMQLFPVTQKPENLQKPWEFHEAGKIGKNMLENWRLYQGEVFSGPGPTSAGPSYV